MYQHNIIILTFITTLILYSLIHYDQCIQHSKLIENYSTETKLIIQNFIKKYPKMKKDINRYKFERINKMFKLIVPILNRHKVRYFADYGTLLGIVRDNYILPWDYDVDFSILAKNRKEIDNDHFRQSLLNVGLVLKRSINNTYKIYFANEVKFSRQNYYKPITHIDFYVWFDSHNRGNNIVTRGCHLNWSPMVCDKIIMDYKRNLCDILPLKKIYVNQIKSHVLVPNNYIKLLKDTYGDNWQVPVYTHI
jgi:hypothetical protein